MLMKPPRCRASVLPVIIAIAGTNRPDCTTMKTVLAVIAIHSGEAPRWVSHEAAPAASTAMIANSGNLPYMSAKRPMGLVKSRVKTPPLRKFHFN